MTSIKLFCLPYAGGSAAIFNKWNAYLHDSIELRPIELAGRGRRIHHPLYENLAEAVDDVFNLIKKELDGSQYALFGHSMGSIITYQLAQKIKENELYRPSHIFFSGRGAPHIREKEDKQYHLMSDAEFKKELLELGGTPAELFQHPELLQLLLPLLKRDFKISETQLHNGKIVPLDSDITVFVGKDEYLSYEQCNGWKQHTSRHCRILYFEGGHFFLNHETKALVTLINGTLTEKEFARLRSPQLSH
jgi:medium-chain acyl-[acyl-carrier-protein] hydrolase